MAEPRLEGGRLLVPGSDGSGVAVPNAAELLPVDGDAWSVPFSELELTADGWVAGGAARGMEVRQRWTSAPHGWELEVTATLHGDAPRRGGMRIAVELDGAGEPWWMVPGIFYGPNRLQGNRRRFPGWRESEAEARGDDLLARAWAFRADRAAAPAVFAWSDRAMVGLHADEASAPAPVGIGFGSDAGRLRAWIDLPWREQPVRYADAEASAPPSWLTHEWKPGEPVTLRLSVAVAGPDRHGYAPFLRAMDRGQGDRAEAWMPPEEAAAATAHGLVRWHYRPADHAFYDCVAFDRELAGADGERGDRAAMHVAWVNGIPYAAALLRHARRVGSREYAAAAIDVIDWILANPAPCGTFWGEWRRETGWCGGWNGDRDWLHARTLAEATLFLLRAWAVERQAGHRHPDWEAAVRRNLGFAASVQRADGNLGAYYHARSGEVVGWEGAAGLTWIAALVEGAAALDEPAWLDAARRAGAWYAPFVDGELVYGAPEDVHLTPTSEDGYAAVMAYVALAEAEPADEEWLRLARRAADWSLSFRMTRSVPMPPHTILGAYGYRTRGGDVASPSNQHLHGYGLVCLPEMVRLARRTGDGWLLERTRDHLAWSLQFVARADGDFNAYRGMVSERFYHTDWAQAQGMLLTLSHAWSVGMILGACESVLDGYPDALPG